MTLSWWCYVSVGLNDCVPPKCSVLCVCCKSNTCAWIWLKALSKCFLLCLSLASVLNKNLLNLVFLLHVPEISVVVCRNTFIISRLTVPSLILRKSRTFCCTGHLPVSIIYRSYTLFKNVWFLLGHPVYSVITVISDGLGPSDHSKRPLIVEEIISHIDQGMFFCIFMSLCCILQLCH